MRSIRPSCCFFPPARLDRAHHGCLAAQRPDCNHKKHHDKAENHTGIKQGSTNATLALDSVDRPVSYIIGRQHLDDRCKWTASQQLSEWPDEEYRQNVDEGYHPRECPCSACRLEEAAYQ